MSILEKGSGGRFAGILVSFYLTRQQALRLQETGGLSGFSVCGISSICSVGFSCIVRKECLFLRLVCAASTVTSK